VVSLRKLSFLAHAWILTYNDQTQVTASRKWTGKCFFCILLSFSRILTFLRKGLAAFMDGNGSWVTSNLLTKFKTELRGYLSSVSKALVSINPVSFRLSATYGIISDCFGRLCFVFWHVRCALYNVSFWPLNTEHLTRLVPGNRIVLDRGGKVACHCDVEVRVE
jgi:hypothetical protein